MTHTPAVQINAFSTKVPSAGLFPARQDASERRWFQAACLFIIIFLLSRLIYLACGRIELSEDEAYQWLWSKHPDLSYYSKPPLIAYAQFIGTWIAGDNEFGIRFLSPVLAAALSFLLLRFVAREVNARAAFWLILILAATPLLAVGSTLLTVDALSVFFWVAAMISGWRALNADPTQALGNRSALENWLWTGLFLGLGMMSKYTAATQIVSWAIFFTLRPASRAHLRRAGPYAALAISTLAFLPVLIWNSRHNWITLTHLAERGGLGEPWRFKPKFLGEFLGSELGLLNPIFFIAMIWAAVVFVSKRPWLPLQLYLFCMGAPLFLFYTLYTLRSRVLPNWIAPSVVPLFALMVSVWDERWRAGAHKVKGWLAAGLSVGF